MSPTQLHKRLSQAQTETILEGYVSKQITAAVAMANLDLKHAQFFRWVQRYKAGADTFTLQPTKREGRHIISGNVEQRILEELKKEKQMIENPKMTIRTYNYSAIQDVLEAKYHIAVSVPTIINRAKKHDYSLRRPTKSIHDREVITHSIGELVQHDSSHHLWSPYMEKELYLVTSLDDHSRLLLYAELFERETAWVHIEALKSVLLRYGCPLKYYPDQHSIFRYVHDRDKQNPWHTYTKFTDDVVTQWRLVLDRCSVGVTYALSAQAKGKIERPYRWLQDRIVRTAAKEHLTTLPELRTVLRDLVEKYNTTWVHSTTKEIPIVRFEKALSDQRSLFKPFKLVHPGTDVKDIFCLHDQRTVDAYRTIA